MIIEARYLMTLFLVLLFSLIYSFSAEAARYTFRQGGFTDGGVVTGSFEGQDTVGKLGEGGIDGPDGVICTMERGGCNWPATDTLTSFSIKFSGNSHFESFNRLQETGLYTLYYDIKNNFLQVGIGSARDCCYVDPGLFQYFSGFGSGGGIRYDAFTGESYNPSTSEAMTVSEVPLPASFGLFAVGIAWILGINRRTAVET